MHGQQNIKIRGIVCTKFARWTAEVAESSQLACGLADRDSSNA